MNILKAGARDAPEKSYAQPTDADRIRRLIDKLGLSQRETARQLEVDDRTLRYWCSGQVQPPKMAFLALEQLIAKQRMVQSK
jgi:DNA-binding transcriptional regulator YiaG